MPSARGGIYRIINLVNGESYIGSSVCLHGREREHLNALRRRKHENQHLQHAFDKYGDQAFVFTVLEYIEDTSKLIPREQYYLDTLGSEYNILLVAGNCLGRPCSLETRVRLSVALSGNRHPMYGKHHSAETRAKMSAAVSGERNHNYGKHPSAETRAKMSRAHKGKLRSRAMRKKMSEVRRGRTASEETKRRMSIAQKARWRKVHAGKNL